MPASPRPLPLGMEEYLLSLVVNVETDQLHEDALLALAKTKVALRQVQRDVRGGQTTVKLRFGAYDDEHARVSAGSAVQEAIATGAVNAVALMQGARFVVVAHSVLS